MVLFCKIKIKKLQVQQLHLFHAVPEDEVVPPLICNFSNFHKAVVLRPLKILGLKLNFNY